MANTCSVVLLPCLYAAWLGRISLSNLSISCFLRNIAKILRIIESNMIGQRLPIGPLVLPDFCIGFKIP